MGTNLTKPGRVQTAPVVLPTPVAGRCSTIRNAVRNATARVRHACTSFDRVGFQQSCARGIVSLVGNTSTAFLSTGAKKFAELELQRSGDYLPLTVGRAATAATTGATVAVAAVDTVFAKVFEEEGKGTWAGIAKRNLPGLAAAIGATFITGAALPEALGAYAVYKATSRVLNFFSEYGDDADARLINLQPAVSRASAVAGTLTQAAGVIAGTHAATKKN